MSGFVKTWMVVLLPALVVSACAKTEYVGYDDKNAADRIFAERTVMVEIDREYYRDYPDCVVVMPPKVNNGLKRIATMVEESLSLRLSSKISRVISGAERDLAARRMAIDLTNQDDIDVFVNYLGCDALLRTTVAGPGKTYLIVWSQVRIGLDVKMIRVRDHHLLWRARHVADRSEGGIPFTPFGAVMDGYSSANFSADREIVDSVVDDAVRRIVASLPDGVSYRRNKDGNYVDY